MNDVNKGTTSILSTTVADKTTTNISSSSRLEFCVAALNDTLRENDDSNERLNVCKARSESYKILQTGNTTSNDTSSNTDGDQVNLTEIRSLTFYKSNSKNKQPQQQQHRRSNNSDKVNTESSCASNNQQDDYLNGECGPHCRPSCITLQLDLNRIQGYGLDRSNIMCPPIANDYTTTNNNDTENENTTNSTCSSVPTIDNPCSFRKRRQRQQQVCNDTSSKILYNEYPSCFLEDATCYGPVLYNDDVALYKKRLLSLASKQNDSYQLQLPHLEHCTLIPTNYNSNINNGYKQYYERFHDWKVITPMEVENDCNSSNNTCFGSNTKNSSKLFFEYCNVVEEDVDSCHSCERSSGDKDDNCNQRCKKVIQPFPNGWTTFVVSASIPYSNLANMNQTTLTTCTFDDNFLSGINETNSVCFMQRIEIYYPDNCPYCHRCPYNVELGDTFGLLEVVSFGSSRQLHPKNEQSSSSSSTISNSCAPCNRKLKVKLSSATKLKCSQLQSCHESVDCNTGQLLGLPSYLDNQCSFQNVSDDSTINDDDAVQEDSIDDDEDDDDIILDDDGRDDTFYDDDDVDNYDDDYFKSTKTPTKPINKKTNPPTFLPTTWYSSDNPSIAPTVVPNSAPNIPPTSIKPNVNGDNNGIINSKSTNGTQLIPIVTSLIVVGLLAIISIQLILYKKRLDKSNKEAATANRINANTEEIVYIEEPLEFDGIDKILSSDNVSQKTDDDEDDVDDESFNSNNLKAVIATTMSTSNNHSSSRWMNIRNSIFRDSGHERKEHQPTSDSVSSITNEHQHQQQQQQQQIQLPEVRYFQTASILERSNQNEIEALYMTGKHHIVHKK